MYFLKINIWRYNFHIIKWNIIYPILIKYIPYNKAHFKHACLSFNKCIYLLNDGHKQNIKHFHNSKSPFISPSQFPPV